MSRWGRDPEERRLELAYALGNDVPPVEHFRRLSRARYGDDDTDGDSDGS
jgi:hypothetical protein